MRRILWLVLAIVTCGNEVRGEYPALEAALSASASEISGAARSKSVLVAARNISGVSEDWRITAAVQTELTALLREQGVDAHDCAAELQFEWLIERQDPFLPRDVTRSQRIGGFQNILVCELSPTPENVNIDLELWSVADEQREFESSLTLPLEAFRLPANVPDVSQRVVEYAQSQFGKQCGNGDCWTLAAVALRESEARREGVYLFGRVLGGREALLPGDILQFERALFQAPGGGRRRRMSHHTAVIEEILGVNVVQVLHQNFGSGDTKKTVQRLVLHLDELREGRLVAFRPRAGGEPTLPDVQPRRRGAATLARTPAGEINLLATIDPHLDSIRGMWHDQDGPLQVPREPRAQLQIPVDLPRTYTVRGRIERLQETGLFGLGLAIFGQPSLLVFQTSFVGLDSLDGKRANANDSSVQMVPLPFQEEVNFECRVDGNRVELDINGERAMFWQGDIRRLKENPSWTPPNPNWLLLAGHESRFAIHELSLEIEAPESAD